MPQAVTAVATAIYVAVGTTAAALGASSATAAALATAAVSAASAATQVAILAGLNAVVAHNNKPRPQGGLINLTINPNEPRRLQVGTRINGGVLADWYVQGTKNQRLFMIVYLGEGPMGRITKVYGGGREVYSTAINHGTRTTIPNYRSGGDRLWITYYDGRPGQTADSYLISQGVGWSANHVGAGCAYAIIEALWDSDNQMTPPQLSFEMEGAKLYDRRKDTTAGGSGAHRANNPATWELSSNPAVALDHYLLGRYSGTVKTFGVGLAASDVPYTPFAARANLADEDVNRKVSGTLKRYAANGFLFADRSYSDTIRDLCRAMNARPADLGGRIGIIDGEEKTPVMTLADADVIDGVPESYTPKRSWADLVSVVRGTYQNPAQLYQAGEYPRVTDAAWTAQDGGSPREATLDLEMETDVERAQRLATLFARRERRQAQLTGTYALRTIELEQGDWFIRAGGIFGAGKTFEVIDRVLDARSMTVTITAFEVDPADSAWVASTAIDAPPAAIANTDTLQAMAVPSLTVTGVTLSGTVADLPAIRVQWTAPDDPRVRQIVVEAVPTAGGVPVSQTVDVGTAQVVFTNGITDDTAYLVRARFIGDFIPSAFTANVAVTTLGDYSVGTATSVPWSGVTGTGRPADNADVTAANTAAGIAGQGSGATANNLAGLNTTDNNNLTQSLSTSRRLVVSDFSADGRHWTTDFGGTPEAVADPAAEGYSDVASVGRVIRFNGFPRYLQPKGVITPMPGRRYAVIARVRTETAPTGGTITFDVGNINGLNTSFGHGDPTAPTESIPNIPSNVAPAAGAWTLVGRVFKMAASPNAFNAYWRPRIDILATGSGGRAEVSSLLILDVTDVPLGRIVTGLLRDDGTTPVTESAIITGLGTAAGIAGQGALATQSVVAFGGALVSGFGTLAGEAFIALNSTLIRRADGTTTLSETLVITSAGTAAAIFGQGWGATASEAAASNARLPLGVNEIVNSELIGGSNGVLGWFINGYNTTGQPAVNGINLPAYHGVTNVVFATIQGTPATSTVYEGYITSQALDGISGRRAYLVPVTATGERFFASIMAARHRCNFALQINWYNSSVGFLSSSTLQVGGRVGGALGGVLANFDRIGGFATAPSGAAYAAIVPVLVGTNEADPYIFWTQPMLTRVSATQTEWPIYNPGPPDRRADPTIDNTASGITGQGPFATGNYYEQSTDPGAVANGSFWFKTTTNELFVRRSAAWGKVATIANQNISTTRTNGFVKTRIGSGTITSDSVSFSSTGGSGTGYTYAHELFATYTTGPSPTISSASGSPITASASGAVPGDEVRGFIQTTATDSAGNKSTLTSPLALFCES